MKLQGSTLLRCQFTPDCSIDAMQSESNSQLAFLVEIDMLTLIFIPKYTETRLAKNNFEKKEQN